MSEGPGKKHLQHTKMIFCLFRVCLEIDILGKISEQYFLFFIYYDNKIIPKIFQALF